MVSLEPTQNFVTLAFWKKSKGIGEKEKMIPSTKAARFMPANRVAHALCSDKNLTKKKSGY